MVGESTSAVSSTPHVIYFLCSKRISSDKTAKTLCASVCTLKVYSSTNFHSGWRRTAASVRRNVFSLSRVFQGVCWNNSTSSSFREAATRYRGPAGSLSPSPSHKASHLPKESHFGQVSMMWFPQSVQSLQACRWRSEEARLEKLSFVTQLLAHRHDRYSPCWSCTMWMWHAVWMWGWNEVWLMIHA